MTPALSAAHSASAGANNFGALRLMFAYLVMLSHAPELLDGDRSREVLTRIFHTLSFGELAVDCFFIISGFLITQSYLASSSNGEYLAKRVLRIYPGFMAAVAFSVFLVAPWAGGRLDASSVPFWTNQLTDALLLRAPSVAGAFATNHYPNLNASLWTISYEFMAYLAVMLAGSLRLLSRPRLILVLAVVLFAVEWAHRASAGSTFPGAYYLQKGIVGSSARFLGLFAAGSLFWLCRDRIRYSGRGALLAAVALAALMGSAAFARLAIATFGAYLIFYVALHVRSERLARIGRKNDLSYGVYLYAWPVQSTLAWVAPSMSPWLQFPLAVLLVTPLAVLSWVVVERPAIRLKGRIKQRFEQGSRGGRGPSAALPAFPRSRKSGSRPGKRL